MSQRLWLVYLVLIWDFGDDLGDGPFKLFNADVLKDDSPLWQQPHLRGNLLTLTTDNMES